MSDLTEAEKAMRDLIITAWHSVTDLWFSRRNKLHDERQWEVVHDWGGDIASDDTQRVVDRFSERRAAEELAKRLEDEARGAAVLALLRANRT